MGLIAICLLN